MPLRSGDPKRACHWQWIHMPECDGTADRTTNVITWKILKSNIGNPEQGDVLTNTRAAAVPSGYASFMYFFTGRDFRDFDMDNYPLIRKCLTVGIILFFVEACLDPVPAQNIAIASLPTMSGHWLYVGGSGPGNYSVIQDAIDNASDGDTVYVYHGIYSDFSTYYACIEIKKVISLTGENKFNTILNGTGYARVLTVDADDVSVSGFTIQNGGAPDFEGYSGWGIDISSGHRNIRIYDNIITENNIGIWIDDNSTDVLIYDNSIIGNYYGIETKVLARSLRFIIILFQTIMEMVYLYYYINLTFITILSQIIQ